MKNLKTDETVLFRCSCGESKYLEIDVYHWDDEPKEYLMGISYEPLDFWYRLKQAWEIIWKGKVFTHEIVLEEEDWKKLEEFFREHSDENGKD